MIETAVAAAPGLTLEQERAIALRAASVALSAGAGCGKTFVLTERFLSHFEPGEADALRPEQLSQLVAITFTDRAAREMRDRIRRKCYDRLMAARDDDESLHWSKLLRNLDGARVSTIHSFCGALLRSHAVEARLDPGFAVLEQSQAQTLLAEVLDDGLRARLSAQDEVTLDLVVKFGLEKLRGMLARITSQGSPAEFQAWLARSPADIVERWAAYHRDEVATTLLRSIAHCPAADTLLEVLAENVPRNTVMQQRRDYLLKTLSAWRGDAPSCADLKSELAQLREHAKVAGGGGKSVWDDAQAYESVLKGAETLRHQIDRRIDVATFDPAAALPAAELGLNLLRFAAEMHDAYTTAKQELSVLDFNDLLARAYQLLTGPEHESVRRRLSAQIHLLLVDEFQDTDPVQVELVAALCGEGLQTGKLFFVGDYKQSIYRFRGAKPQVFRELRDATPEAGRLPLTLNFRSQPAILDFVNALFWTELGDGYEPLRAHRPQISPTPAIEFLWAPNEQPKESRDQQRAREADWIARRLRGVIDGGEPIVWDQAAARDGRPATRAARPGDIALLFRALSNVDVYENALRSFGLDYYLVGGHAFYAQQEIFDLLNLLRAIDSPADAVSLAGALRSPFFSIADETLFWLAQHPDGLVAGFYARKRPVEIDAEQRRRVAFAVSTLTALRSRKDSLRLAELIDEALTRTGYDAALLAEFLGERKLANLRKLIDQARSFDRAGIFSLSDFIAQLSDFVADQPDEPLAATHPESTDVIRLMTIHQSKGLEFPIVVVPDLDRASHGRTSAVEFTRELGPLVKMPTKTGASAGQSGYDLHAAVEDEQEQAESKRLLYVATTRAADCLILSGGVKAVGEASGPWTRLLARRFDLADGAFLGKLPVGHDVPAVRVTHRMPEPELSALSRARRQPLDEIVASAASIAAKHDAPPSPLIEPVPVDAAARRQYSFSRLNGRMHRERVVIEDFSAGVGADGAPRLDPLGLGTLAHAVLAEIDFAAPVDVAALVARHAERHLPNPRGEAPQAAAMIERFAKSDRAKQLAAARQTYTELEFLLRWETAGPEQGVYLSGFIDRLYQDSAGAWHVLDYKTNRATADDLAEVAAPYQMQMAVYALAAERTLGQSPKSLTLCFLRPGLEYTFPWNAAAREQVMQMVDRAIAGQCS